MHQLHKISKQKPVEIVALTVDNLPAYMMEEYDKVFPKGWDEKVHHCDTFDHLNQASWAVKFERYINADIPPGMYNFVEQDGDVFLSKVNEDSTDYITLTNNPAAKLSVDVANFFDHDKVYSDMKIAKKRGSLLYGPPGNGKSREVLQAALVFTAKNPTGIGLSINSPNEVWFLNYLRKEKPSIPLFVVFEELTNFTDSRDELNTKLLNMLDGSEGIDNVYIVATTNYPTRLSQNITNRPGRFHNIIEVPNPKAALRKEFLSKFMDAKEVIAMMEKTDDDFSLAHLKEIIVYASLYEISYLEAVKKVKEHMKLVKRSFAKISDKDDGQYL
jgi:SpoVK/Ycf46/Vps4 family AAA+-type ATPase